MLNSIFIIIYTLIKSEVAKYINPYVLEWGMHYVGGSQKDKTLPKELIPITKAHIVMSMLHIPKCFGWALCYPYKQEETSCWYTHPTMGVVGGFTYRLISWEDSFVVECTDTWDFNRKDYVIPFPKWLSHATQEKLFNLLNKFSIPVEESWVEDEYGSVVKIYGIKEEWLSKYNETHSFSTKWEVVLPNKLKCDLK